MDVAGVSISLSASNLASKQSISVLKMAKESMEQNGEQVSKMIEGTSVKHPNSTFDMKV